MELGKEQVRERDSVFLRIDKLQVEMPMPTEPDPDAAAAVFSPGYAPEELGEMAQRLMKNM